MLLSPTADPNPSIPATRRRVWAAPALRSHGLIVLTANQLVLSPDRGPPRPEVLAAAELGDDLEELFGPLATTIGLRSVGRATLDLLRNSVTLAYAGPAGPTRVRIEFESADAADSCFTKLWRRMGQDCALRPYRREGWALAAAPLGLLAAVLLLTAVLTITVSSFDEHAHDRPAGVVSVPAAGSLGNPGDSAMSPLECWLGWMDWRVICGFGGAAAAGTQVWLYRRLTAPPRALVVVRGA
ncbi:MAG: hypothetical protein U0804_16265 [Gemmataceae bacterium]